MYWVLQSRFFRDGAFLESTPEDGPGGLKYDVGVSLIDSFPDRPSAIMYYDEDYEGIKLYDFVPNMDSVLVVHDKVKTLYDTLGLDRIEYLPIRLCDHQKKIASDDYFIVNPLALEPIIDMEKSDCEMNPFRKTQVYRTKNLVVNKEVEIESKLFRASTKTDSIFVHDDVVVALDKAGITGYKVLKAEGWDGLSV